MLAGSDCQTYHNFAHKALGLLCACVAFARLTTDSASAQNVIQNGDFEAPPFAPSSLVTNWTVGGTGHVHSITEGSTTGTHSIALSVGHDSEGTIISQTFPTAAGEVYRVDFDSAVFGTPSSAPLQLNVHITGSGTLLNQTVTPPAALTFDPDQVIFAHFYFTFTAN